MSMTGSLTPDSVGSGVKRTLEDAEAGVRPGAGTGPGELGNKKYKQDLASLPTRQYLDQTVVPILLQVAILVYLNFKTSIYIALGVFRCFRTSYLNLEQNDIYLL